MYTHLFIPFLLCFVVQLVSVSSSPLVERAAATCSANDIATVKRTTPDSVYFCQWWQQALRSPRTASPFMEFSPTQVDALCKCISPVATGAKCKRRRKRSNIEERADAATTRSASSCSAEVSAQFTQPWRFCTFFTSYPRTTSPFQKYTASALTSLCKCAITKPASTTSKNKKVTTTSMKVTTTSKKVTTTSKKVSTTSKKVTTTAQKIVTTSKKVSTTTKPTTVQKPVTTSTKKPTTTSTKKPTTTSTKKPTTTSTKKPTTTSTKKPTTTSTKKPTTTSIKKVTSTSTKKPTVTSTKKPATTSNKPSSSSTKKPTTTSSKR
ncbi:unnamed protein product, partial [Aureobasidium vineae]